MPIQMKKKNRSISQLIARAKSKEQLLSVVLTWAEKWETEQTGLIDRLGKAIADDDFDDQCICAGELRGITEKRFVGLKNAISKIVERIDDGNSDC